MSRGPSPQAAESGRTSRPSGSRPDRALQRRTADQVQTLARQAGATDTCFGDLIELGLIVLPQPTEDHPHWFGLNAYTTSLTGQHLLFKGLAWERP